MEKCKTWKIYKEDGRMINICAVLTMSILLTACVSQKEYDAVVDRNGDLAKQVKDLKNENEDLSEQIEELQSEKDELSEQITILQSDMEEMQSRMEGVESNVNDDSDTTQNSGEILVPGLLKPIDPPKDENPYGNLEGFSDIKIHFNGRDVSAYRNDTIYLLYASSPEGNTGWYLYDSVERRWIRYAGILTSADIVSDPETLTFCVAMTNYSPPNTVTDEESKSILPMDPPANENGELCIPYLPKDFKEELIRTSLDETFGYTDEVFYVFYARSPEGNCGWYMYDFLEGRWIRFVFDFTE